MQGFQNMCIGVSGSGSVNPQYHTYSLHCSSFLGLPYRILIIYLVKPKKGTTMETIGTLCTKHHETYIPEAFLVQVLHRQA